MNHATFSQAVCCEYKTVENKQCVGIGSVSLYRVCGALPLLHLYFGIFRSVIVPHCAPTWGGFHLGLKYELSVGGIPQVREGFVVFHLLSSARWLSGHCSFRDPNEGAAGMMLSRFIFAIDKSRTCR
jgi:hypothetical protein